MARRATGLAADTDPGPAASRRAAVMETAEPHTFAEALRRYRVEAGLTQEQLAERAGVSARCLGDLERGGPHVPRRTTMRQLADALGLPASERACAGSLVRP